jgi:hypothetical protein
MPVTRFSAAASLWLAAAPALLAAPLTDAQVEQRAAALLSQMTLAEKVGQLTQVGAFPGMDPARGRPTERAGPPAEVAKARPR